jgi:hypothetical protein
MGAHMKTTVEISNALLEETRRAAAQDRTTVKALIEEGLRRVLVDRKRKSRFHLRRATFKGRGLHPQLEGASWDRIRDTIYEGRGG